MKNDRMFIQMFAVVALIATALCVFQENALGAVVLLLVATALVFIARNIGHLMKVKRDLKKMVCTLRLLIKLIRDYDVAQGTFGGAKICLTNDLTEMIDSLDKLEQEMSNRIE